MIKLVRLDYRLLHGQVVFAWTGYVGAQRIIIVDNETASDELKKTALSLSKPAGVRLNIFSLETTLAKMPKVETLNENIMMIFGNTKTLRAFCEAYLKIREINYGALANREHTKQYASCIFLTDSEAEDTRALMAMGIRLNVQQTPSHKKETMDL